MTKGSKNSITIAKSLLCENLHYLCVAKNEFLSLPLPRLIQSYTMRLSGNFPLVHKSLSMRSSSTYQHSFPTLDFGLLCFNEVNRLQNE